MPSTPRVHGLGASRPSSPGFSPVILSRSLLVPMATEDSRPLHHPWSSPERSSLISRVGGYCFLKVTDCDLISTISVRHDSINYLPHLSTPDKTVREFFGRVQSSTLLSSHRLSSSVPEPVVPSLSSIPVPYLLSCCSFLWPENQHRPRYLIIQLPRVNANLPEHEKPRSGGGNLGLDQSSLFIADSDQRYRSGEDTPLT